MKFKSKFLGVILAGILSVSMIFTGCSPEGGSGDSGENTNETLSNGNLQVHFIDTGNSDAILIDDDGVAMLIDAGDNDDETSVVNYIKARGINEIKYLVSTHAHADHAGGLDNVVKECKIDRAFVSNGDADTATYRDFIMALSDKGLDPSVPLEGKQFKLKNAYFEVFNTNGGSTTNNESLVILLTNGNDKMLFTGDAEKEVEYEILDKMPDVDLLKVGHHGSHSSSTKEFLDKTNPEYAVILCGRNNDYGHPHRETMAELKERGIEVYRTDQSGDIVFTSTGNGLTTKSQPGDYSNGSSSGGTSSSPSYESGHKKQPDEKNKYQKKVYWTKNGKVYHKYKDCEGLKDSKKVFSGTVKESGKPRLCKKCSDR